MAAHGGVLASVTLVPLDVQPKAQAEEQTRRRDVARVLTIVLVAFVIRLFFVSLNYKSLPLSNHFEDFGAEMGWTARSIATGHGFASPYFPQTGPTALVPPLFPFILAGIFRVFGLYSNAAAFAALALNSLFSSLTAAVIFMGMRKRFGLRAASCAAWLWALYPYSVYYSAVYLWDCALTSLLFASCFFLATTRLPHYESRGWALFGALCGLTVLGNPSVLTLLPCMMCFAAWQRRRFGGAFVVRQLVVALVFMAAVLAPWSIRNSHAFHQPVFLRDGFWGEFYAGNNGDTSRSNPDWTHPASNPDQMRRYQQLGEIGYMREKQQMSLEYLKSHPGEFALTSVRRVVRYWTGYWSLSRSYLRNQPLDVPNVPFCIILTVVMLIGVRQIWRKSRLLAVPYAAVLMIFPLPYYVTHSSIDYRQPIEPLVVVTVAVGAKWLWERKRASFPASNYARLREVG